MSLIITIVIIAVVALYVISVQNKLVKADEICKNALKQINVQQVSRYDALAALVKLTKDYSAHEFETLTKTIESRRIVSSPAPSVADINANEQALAGLKAQINAVAESYPNLKADEMYIKTMNSVREYEENVRLSRMTFNDTVTRYNNVVRMFPSSIVASVLGFPVRDYLTEDTKKNDYPDALKYSSDEKIPFLGRSSSDVARPCRTGPADP